jgi:hypothetical protein
MTSINGADMRLVRSHPHASCHVGKCAKLTAPLFSRQNGSTSNSSLMWMLHGRAK